MKETTEAKPGIATNQLTAPAETLRDFTTTWRVLPITGLALVIGVVAAYVAVVLLKLISFFTNVFFFQRFTTAPASPGDTHLGPWVILVPVIGGLIVGLMARFGSDKIRFHGHFHRLWRSVRRGRPHYHDGRRIRFSDRPILPPYIG